MKISILTTLLFISTASWATPARIILIRHAEKTTDKTDIHLSAQGYQRAEALRGLFDIHPDYASPTLPNHVFAAQYIPSKNSERCVETVTPLAQKLNLTVETPYAEDQYKNLANELLSNPIYDGQVILIAWEHSILPSLAQALGNACAQTWDGAVFDRAWILDYKNGQNVSCTDKPESVMPGDSQ